MDLFCPDSSCTNHRPPGRQWFDYHGWYISCGKVVKRYRCRSCGRTFSNRTLSIDYWTHSHLDYEKLITLFVSGFSLRGLSRYFQTSVKTIQNRLSRLSRTIIPTLSVVQRQILLNEDLVADGLENFFVSQDYPNNIHILVGKRSQYTYGLNYALMRRKGRKTEEQKRRCERQYPQVDFTRHTILKGFSELIGQMKRVSGEKATYRLYTDEKRQYRIALREDAVIGRRTREGDFEHVQINSQRPRSLSNDLFSVNYLDREVRKDLPEYHRQTVCFGRNVGNGLERLCVYFYHHNFIKKYRIGVKGENRTHAEVAGLSRNAVMRIRSQVTKNRRFIGDGEIVKGGFFEELWKRRIPTPLKNKPDYLPAYAIA